MSIRLNIWMRPSFQGLNIGIRCIDVYSTMWNKRILFQSVRIMSATWAVLDYDYSTSAKLEARVRTRVQFMLTAIFSSLAKCHPNSRFLDKKAAWDINFFLKPTQWFSTLDSSCRMLINFHITELFWSRLPIYNLPKWIQRALFFVYSLYIHILFGEPATFAGSPNVVTWYWDLGTLTHENFWYPVACHCLPHVQSLATRPFNSEIQFIWRFPKMAV